MWWVFPRRQHNVLDYSQQTIVTRHSTRKKMFKKRKQTRLYTLLDHNSLMTLYHLISYILYYGFVAAHALHWNQVYTILNGKGSSNGLWSVLLPSGQSKTFLFTVLFIRTCECVCMLGQTIKGCCVGAEMVSGQTDRVYPLGGILGVSRQFFKPLCDSLSTTVGYAHKI